MALINAYHGVDAATHPATITGLSKEAYHQVTLCVYGDPGSPLYAAAWAKEPWPQWIAVHGETAPSWSLNGRTAAEAGGKTVSALDKFGDDITNLLNGIHWP